jgi:murein DD-endopeptidase MepM/ murein hydrolase activator NlpD
MCQRLPGPRPRLSVFERFGIRSGAQVVRDVGTLLGRMGSGDPPVLDPSTAGLFRPDLSLPAYAGFAPSDGISPIFNLFDRVGGGRGFAGIVTRRRARDFRGGRLTYDEHDGTDFVCPPGTPLACAAPGVVVAVRDRFLRGGLTASVDHGHGVITQYTHLARMVAEVGAPVERGATVALSGTAGMDMVSGFPWVPPHVHFMVWVRGRPVDPYLSAGESRRPGSWLHANEPRPSGRLPDDGRPFGLDAVVIDDVALEALVSVCLDPEIREELERARHPASRLALLEDSVHHDRHAWPVGTTPERCRPPADASAVRLTLPLPSSIYCGARPSDSRWTAPSAGAAAPHAL